MKAWGWVMIVGVLLAGCWLVLELRANRAEAEWREFVTTWEARGEAFDVDANLPPVLPDEENFAEHPWVKKVLEGDPVVSLRLDEMDIEWVEGYDEWLSSSDDEDVLPVMSAELAERVWQQGNEFEPELRELEKALERPGIRFSESLGHSVGRLMNPSKCLNALAHAAISRGNVEAFTRFLTMELRAGACLRKSNLNMGVVMGAGFEANAYRALRSLPDLDTWPDSEKAKWLDALDLRTRAVADECVATLRVDRGNFLKLIEIVERTPVKARSLKELPSMRRELIASARLAACREFQEEVLANGAMLETSIAPKRLERFLVDMKTRKGGGAGAESGRMMYFPTSGIYASLESLEKDRGAVRERLEKSMGKGTD